MTQKLFENIDYDNDSQTQYYCLKNCNSNMYKVIENRFNEKKFNHLINTNQISEALKLYVELQFQSKLKVCGFDYISLSKKCNGTTLPMLYHDVNFCIFAHLTDFKGTNGLRYNIQSAKSLINILKQRNKQFPSELYESNSMYNQEKFKLSYIFRHICNVDLLNSILVGYSVNTENIDEQNRMILNERRKLLLLSLELDDESEKTQIKTQIKETEQRMDLIGNISLDETVISYAKILHNAINVSDTDIILPFYQKIQSIISKQKTYDFKNARSGEFLIFKDAFIKYKKAYVISLDEQIGINIRHGFFKKEIIKFFVDKGFAFKQIPSKDEDLQSFIINEAAKKSNGKPNVCTTTLINEMVEFSRKLYSIIDDLLAQMKISHTSRESSDIFKIYMNDKEISYIAEKSINCIDPYELKSLLNYEMANIMNSKVNIIGGFIENELNYKCLEIIRIFLTRTNFNAINLNSKEFETQKELSKLCNKIKQWFYYIKDGNEWCSINKYFLILKKRNTNIDYNLSSNFPEKIKLFQLHGLDLILSNLIMNADEHSGLNKDELVIFMSLSSENNIMKVYFKNNLNSKTSNAIILRKIATLEENIKNSDLKTCSDKGNGFNHIVQVLKSLVGSKWGISFCKNELPKFFALNITIDWSGYIE